MAVTVHEDRVERKYDTDDMETLDSFWTIINGVLSLLDTNAMRRLKDRPSGAFKHMLGNSIICGFLWQMEVLERSLKWLRNSMSEVGDEMSQSRYEHQREA